MKHEEPEAMKQIHEIRDRIFEETKNLTPEERRERTRNSAQKFLDENHIELPVIRKVRSESA